MRAAVYLRQSKDLNGAGLAIERQRKACLALCQAREWKVVTEYVDNDTSASKSRDGSQFGQLLHDARAGRFDVVVAFAADRIARRLSDVEMLISTGVKAATVQGGLDLTTPEGEAQAAVLTTFARLEVRQKSERQKAAAVQAAQQGRPHVGPRAFGYEADGMTLRPSEAEALRAAYASLLAGSTLVSLCRELTAKGFVTPAGKPFRHSGIRAILLNPRNAAIRAYWYKEVGPANWPAIVDEETFRAAEALLTDSERRKNHGTARRWLLGGLALCGRCDDGTTVRVNYRERGAAGEPVRVYRCRKEGHLSREASFCDWRVTERVIARLSRDDARDLLIDDDREDLAELRAQESVLRMRLDQLADDFADGTATHSQFRSGTERLKTRLADLEARMVHVDRAAVLADLVTTQDVRKVWNTIGLDRQRAVIDLLYTVTLLPRGPGRVPATLESVRMEPKA
jgi:site-specific DNA recombinase